MEYMQLNGKDYLIFEDNQLEIDRWYFNDPEDAGLQITELMVRQLIEAKPAFGTIRVADTKIFTIVGYPFSNHAFTVQLGEVRNDCQGLLLTEPMPGVNGDSVLPMVQLVGNEERAETVLFSNEVEFGYIAQMVFNKICESLTASTDTIPS